MNSTSRDPWRLYVRLRSHRLLKEYVKHMGLSGRELAKRAGLGHAIVGHLLKGTRTTCNPATAKAIEEALGCPPGLLFEPFVASVRDAA